MPYVKTFDRNQLMMVAWDSLVADDSDARIIDKFVDGLNLGQFDIKEAAIEGRPLYDPKGMLKLYIYGYKNQIRSSRKLAKNCKVNIEVKWLIGGVEPDYRTISEFRRKNAECLKKIFHEFNKRIDSAVEWGFISVDGSKFQACNSKDRNFTKNKIDDRIKWLDGHIEEYMRVLDAEDKDENSDSEERKLVEEKLKEAKERQEKYKCYQREMEESGAAQKSLTDSDARLMKNKNGFTVSYNPQTAVDSNTHIIRDYNTTNQVTDHGLLFPTLKDIKKNNDDEIIEVVADKGYEQDEDMIACLENGIIPHVITDDGKDSYELEISYEEAEANEKSNNPEEIKKCLHAGVIPEVYKDIISGMEVKTVRRKDLDSEKIESEKSVYGTEESMKARALEGYFVRDPERNLVYCPAGEILRQKCIKKNGSIRYANKTACRHCKNRNKCYKGKNEWKEIDFTKDGLERPCKTWNEAEETIDESQAKPKRKASKFHYKVLQVVKFFLKPDRQKTAKRMCLSEHPFGTIKRAMGATYFLLKGMRKVDGEFALMCLGYNIERAKNMLGFNKLMELMVQ